MTQSRPEQKLERVLEVEHNMLMDTVIAGVAAEHKIKYRSLISK
jgi:hypothetical protein